MNDNLYITIAYNRWKGKDSRFNDYTVYRYIKPNDKENILLNTNSKYELRMWLDLNDMKIGTETEKVNETKWNYINFDYVRGKSFNLIHK